MSDKAYNISCDIYRKYKHIYKPDKLTITFMVVLITSVISNFINFYSETNSIIIYTIFLFISIFSFIIIYLKSKTYNDKVSNHNIQEEMLKIFRKHKLKSGKQFHLLKEEIEEKLKEIDKNIIRQINIISKLFLFIFWVPSGFLFAYYFNSSNEKLSFNTLTELLPGLLVIFIQLSILYSIIYNLANPLVHIFLSERHKYKITLNNIYNCLYYIEN